LKRQRTATAFARYTLVGAGATLAHWALLAALVEVAALPAWAASGAGAVLGAQLGFFGNRRVTFDHQGPMAPAWRRFMLTAAAGALLGMAIVAAGVALGAHYLLAQVAATALVLVVTFSANRRWTFGQRG